MHQELRCDNGILFGHLEDGVLEVKCRSNRCAAGTERGAVIIHRFDVRTGSLLSTRKFRDPIRKVGGSDAVG